MKQASEAYALWMLFLCCHITPENKVMYIQDSDTNYKCRSLKPADIKEK